MAKWSERVWRSIGYQCSREEGGLALGGGEVEFGEVALAGGADLQEGAVGAFGVGEGAEGVGVELDEGVVVVEEDGVPGFGDEAHEAGFGGGGVGAGDDAEALDDAEVVGVDGEGAAAESAEVDDGGGDLGADSFELLEPVADFFGAVFGEEVEGEGSDTGGDLLEEGFEARGLLLGEGDDGEGSFEVGKRGVADRLPVGGAGVECALKVAEDLLGGGGFGAGGEEGVDELGEGVGGDAGLGLAVVAEEETMDVGELVGLLGGERAMVGVGFGGGGHGRCGIWVGGGF